MVQFQKLILWFKNYATSQAFLDKFQKENLSKQNLGQSVKPVVIIVKKISLFLFMPNDLFDGHSSAGKRNKIDILSFQNGINSQIDKGFMFELINQYFLLEVLPNVINTTIFKQQHIIIQKEVIKDQQSSCNFPLFYSPTPVLYYILPPNTIYPLSFKNPQEFINLDRLKQTGNNVDIKDQQANACFLDKGCQSSSVIDEKSRKYNEVKKQYLNSDYLLQLKDVKSRNILPNAINLILSFIRRINKSGRIAKKIIEKIGKGLYDVKKYYSYQAYLKDVITSYTSKNILHLVFDFCNPSCKIFTVDEQKLYNIVTRNLVLHFIKVEGPLALFTSKKEHKTRKIDHLKVYRFIIKDLQHYYRIKGAQK